MSLAFLSSFQGGNFNWECHVLFLPLWISEREINVLTAKIDELFITVPNRI